MNNIRKIIEERLDNARNDYKYYQEGSNEFYEYGLFEISGQILAYQDCLNLIDEYTPKIVTKQLSVKEIETLLQDLNKPHQFIIDKPAPRTEADILNDFEKLGYKIKNDSEVLRLKNNFIEIYVYKQEMEYGKEDIFSCEANRFTMQEHKLLNELFICWGWL